jgi:hypothetical protein
MKITFFNFLLCLLFVPLISSAQRTDTAGSAVLFQKFMSQINPRHVSWVKSSAKTVNEKKMSEEEVKNMSSQYAVLGSLNGGDIEALAFLVLMQAAKSSQEDLKAIMAKVKSINEQKKKMREAMAKMNEPNPAISRIQLDSFTLLLTKRTTVTKTQTERTKPVTKTDIDAVKDRMKNDLDSMNEMGEMESLRLQMAMDRMSKMMSTLSNLLKKISDTSNSIVQNLK